MTAPYYSCFAWFLQVIYGDGEENERFYDDHYFRKQELRELKMLQKQEQKQFQDLAFKNNVCRYELVL